MNVLTVAAVFVLFSSLLAACGVAIAAEGGKAAVDGRAGIAAFLITVGLVTLYPAYLFARTAWRTRRAAANDKAVRARSSRKARYFTWYILAGVVTAVLLPVPGITKVILTVMVVGGSIVGMAASVDPPWRSKK